MSDKTDKVLTTKRTPRKAVVAKAPKIITIMSPSTIPREILKKDGTKVLLYTGQRYTGLESEIDMKDLRIKLSKSLLTIIE